MVQKGIRGGICHAIHKYVKANNQYIKNYDKNNETSYLRDVNNLYGWAFSQKLPVNDFKWIDKTSQFNEEFIKICNEDTNIGNFIEADV